jgi:hypothetical protein
MAKNRQIETDLFSQGWFYEISNDAKVLYLYCYLNADNAGIIELIKRKIEYDLQIDLEKSFLEIRSEFSVLGNNRFFMKRILTTQFPNGLSSPSHSFQKSVIKLLENEGIDTITYEITEALPKPYPSLTQALPKALSHSHSLSHSNSNSNSHSNSAKNEKKLKQKKSTMTDEEYGEMMIEKGFKRHGEFGNVYLSDKNKEDAINKVGSYVLKRAIDHLSAYKETKAEGAQTYTKDYAAMCSWVFERIKQDMQKEGLNWREYYGKEMEERRRLKEENDMKKI